MLRFLVDLIDPYADASEWQCKNARLRRAGDLWRYRVMAVLIALAVGFGGWYIGVLVSPPNQFAARTAQTPTPIRAEIESVESELALMAQHPVKSAAQTHMRKRLYGRLHELRRLEALGYVR